MKRRLCFLAAVILIVFILGCASPNNLSQTTQNNPIKETAKTQNINSAETQLAAKLCSSGKYSTQVGKVRNVPFIILTADGEAELSKTGYDLREISNLTCLEYLKVPSNYNVKDVSSIAGLINLKYLDLRHSKVKDISALKNMVNLEFLSLTYTPVSDISALKNMIKLEQLELDITGVSDITSLSNMNNLKTLYLGTTEVSDLTPLKNLTKLEWLTLQNTQITDIAPLGNLVNMKHLFLSSTQIKDISPLRNLKQLIDLNLMVSGITKQQCESLRADLPNINDLVCPFD